jgi:hypothetical protein
MTGMNMLGDYYRHIRINFPINPEVISSSPSKAHRQTTCENAISKESYQGNMLRQIVPHGTGIFEENRRPGAVHNRFVPADK